MFKKVQLSFVIIAMALFIYSCTKSVAVYFTNSTIKTMFDNNCKSFHARGSANSDDWLYDVADYNTSIKKKISTLYNEVYNRRKARPGKNLTDKDYQNFKAWYDSGYPAN